MQLITPHVGLRMSVQIILLRWKWVKTGSPVSQQRLVSYRLQSFVRSRLENGTVFMLVQMFLTSGQSAPMDSNSQPGSCLHVYTILLPSC